MWRRARAVLRSSYGGEHWSSWAVFPEQLQLIPVTLDQSAKAWFYSEKWLCKNGTFVLSRSGRCVLSKLHLLTLVTKISFNGFPALWALQNDESCESRSWILCLIVGLITINHSQQRGCTGTTRPCTAFLLVPAVRNTEERNPSWFSWWSFNCRWHLSGLQLEEKGIYSSVRWLRLK